ncbi:MAG: hypothetical protein ABIN36_15135 [Ferruginibacter sp.]
MKVGANSMISEMYGRARYKNNAPVPAKMSRIMPMIVKSFLPAASCFLLASESMHIAAEIKFSPTQIQQIIFILILIDGSCKMIYVRI